MFLYSFMFQWPESESCKLRLRLSLRREDGLQSAVLHGPDKQRHLSAAGDKPHDAVISPWWRCVPLGHPLQQWQLPPDSGGAFPIDWGVLQRAGSDTDRLWSEQPDLQTTSKFWTLLLHCRPVRSFGRYFSFTIKKPNLYSSSMMLSCGASSMVVWNSLCDFLCQVLLLVVVRNHRSVLALSLELR